MKLTCTLLLLASSALSQATAQIIKPAAKPAPAATSATASHAAAAHPGLHPCDKLPAMSPKIPALPPGSPCARPLYVLSVIPPYSLEYVSPLESPNLRDTLKLPEAARFSLDYIDVKVGAGDLAAPGKWYTVHYTGYLLDGTKFDSSYDHPGAAPFTFPYGQHHVITGWDTGLDGMHIGGKRRLFIPWELAYGPDGKPPTIPAKAELIFDVELLSQSDKDPSAPPPPPSSKAPPATAPSATPELRNAAPGAPTTSAPAPTAPPSTPPAIPTPSPAPPK